MSKIYKLEILELLMAKAGTYNQQFRRPYQTVGTSSALDQIRERVDQLNGRVRGITPSYLAGVAGEFVAPQAAPESNILIPNGWGTERYYFFLKVRVFNSFGGYSVDLIQGYTDHSEILSMHGTMDPNTRFYVNSVTTLKNHTEYGVYGAQNVQNVTDSYHVVANHDWTDISSVIDPNTQSFASMRPGDIYTSLSTQQSGLVNDILDLRVVASRQPRASRRSNNLSTNYASRVINGTLEAISGSMYGSQDAELYTDAAGKVMEASLQTNAFLSAISSLNNLPLSDSFTLKDLYRLDPQLENSSDQRMMVFAGGNPTLTNSYAHQVGMSDGWGGSGHEELAATIISNAITGLMVEYGLAVVHVQATNHNIGGPVVVPRDAVGLAGQDVRESILGFQTRFQNEVIDHISFHNKIAYNIEVRAEIARSTSIMLQIEGNPPMTFVAPSFADALTAPVITSTPDRLATLAYDFGTMLDAVVTTPTPSLESLVNSNGFSTI